MYINIYICIIYIFPFLSNDDENDDSDFDDAIDDLDVDVDKAPSKNDDDEELNSKRPPSLRSTHSLGSLELMLKKWADERSKNPRFVVKDVLDISMNSPNSFSVRFVNEKHVYITSSSEDTEKWIERVSDFTTTSLRTLLTKGATLPPWVPDSDRVSCT